MISLEGYRGIQRPDINVLGDMLLRWYDADAGWRYQYTNGVA